MFLKVSHAQESCIYLIRNTVKTVILYLKIHHKNKAQNEIL